MADDMLINGLPPAAHLVLGLATTATPEEARAAYLEAVRRHPPDREPERFRELHTAMQAFCDPLPLAESAFRVPRLRSDLKAIIAAAAARPPRLPARVLLALGNVPQDGER
ncbi:J domain-containing protein [bacterium]|nr:J domain-containing protein [bacterium]